MHFSIPRALSFGLLTRKKVFFNNYQTIWERKINFEATYFFQTIQFILPSKWEFFISNLASSIINIIINIELLEKSTKLQNISCVFK